MSIFQKLGNNRIFKSSCLVLKSSNGELPNCSDVYNCPEIFSSPGSLCTLKEKQRRIKMRNCQFFCCQHDDTRKAHAPPVDSRSISGWENAHWIIDKTRQKHSENCSIISALSQTETCKSLYCFWMKIVTSFPFSHFQSASVGRGRRPRRSVVGERRRHLSPSLHHFFASWLNLIDINQKESERSTSNQSALAGLYSSVF